MNKPVSEIAFTPAVKAIQERLGSRSSYAKMEQRGAFNEEITEGLAEFIAERDSLYLGTASASGQPYIQHRGGSKGFVKVLDEKTLAWPDYPGNAQYISMGNLSENDQAYIFLMDYPSRTRIKIWGTAEIAEDDQDLTDRLEHSEIPNRTNRTLVFHVKAWDINCRQYITPRYTEEESDGLIMELSNRVADLEQKNSELRSSV